MASRRRARRSADRFHAAVLRRQIEAMAADPARCNSGCARCRSAARTPRATSPTWSSGIGDGAAPVVVGPR
jgi:hypothetical protein